MSSNTEPQDQGAGVTIDVPSEQQQQPEGPAGGHESQPYGYGIFKHSIRYDPIMIVFAILVFAGGLVGYITKGSNPSLVAGTIFALLILAATYLEGARRNPYPLLVVLIALFGVMFYRYINSMNFMPSGLVALLTALAFGRHAYLLYLRRKNQQQQ